MVTASSTFTADERSLIAYIMSGPHITFVASRKDGRESETFKMLEGLGLSIFTWQGDDDSYRASMNQSYSSKGLVVREPSVQGRDAPTDAWKFERLIWQKNWAAAHHVPALSFHGTPSKGEVMLALDLARKQWASREINHNTVRVPYFTPTGLTKLYDMLAPQRSAGGRSQCGNLRRGRTMKLSPSVSQQRMHEEEQNSEEEENIEAILLAERRRMMKDKEAEFGDGSGIRNRPTSAGVDTIDRRPSPPPLRAVQSARAARPRPPSSPPRSPPRSPAEHHADTSENCGGSANARWSESRRPGSHASHSGQNRTPTWGTNYPATTTEWRPWWRPTPAAQVRFAHQLVPAGLPLTSHDLP